MTFLAQDGVPFGHFEHLLRAVEQMLHTGKPAYPVERTLLTTGALSFVMESAHRGHERIETPMLTVAYKAPQKSYYAHGEGS